jgi:hypothetical protein
LVEAYMMLKDSEVMVIIPYGYWSVPIYSNFRGLAFTTKKEAPLHNPSWFVVTNLAIINQMPKSPFSLCFCGLNHHSSPTFRDSGLCWLSHVQAQIGFWQGALAGALPCSP